MHIYGGYLVAHFRQVTGRSPGSTAYLQNIRPGRYGIALKECQGAVKAAWMSSTFTQRSQHIKVLQRFSPPSGTPSGPQPAMADGQVSRFPFKKRPLHSLSSA